MEQLDDFKSFEFDQKGNVGKARAGIGAEESLVIEKISKKYKSSTFHQGNMKHYLRTYMGA